MIPWSSILQWIIRSERTRTRPLRYDRFGDVASLCVYAATTAG
ncbi:hypothetical protein SAMN04487926_16413 [Paraburkholderia steynii]|uniref:Uncharacterized protein n=1 Tax=Paraburkholderia steynii TaxID=1245441 RepID=A0A7Z7FPM4_9BURK|nr:hypothetical protein SAMN04487926_16413 [Paraburkholderia steynii]